MPFFPVVIITGPTATGKTDLSVEIARHFETSIISADARQCYKYLDIGTGKVSKSVQNEIPHYHISTLYPNASFTAADFARKSSGWIQEVHSSNKPVVIAGGSTLYIEAIFRPFDLLPPRNEQNIQKLDYEARKFGIEYIEDKLKKTDPDYAARIDGPNRHRMFRALDVWMQTGKPFSSFHHNRPFQLPQNTLLYCLNRDRSELHERISSRVDSMIDSGLIDEVQSILEMGYSPELQSLQTVGYRESIAYLNNKIPLDTMKETIKTNTRRYARRQLTWFRRWKNNICWLDQSQWSNKDILNKILEDIHQLEADL